MPTPDEMREKYREITAAEETPVANDPGGPLGAAHQLAAREKAMKVFAAARELLADGMLEAAGYRIVVKPIEAIVELEAAEANLAPTLAGEGFEVKTASQKEREERGENTGVVVHIGPVAFERHGGREYWCDEGDTIVFNRYAGTRVEHPPGSRVFYQIMNDEDVYGVIR